MSSTTRKIPPSEWEHHKDTIVELYRNKPLKDVRAEMQDQHSFDASSWQYEMQFKRWNIRKNATRREWQQYFAANEGQPIANSLGDGSGTNFSPVILSKSTASKKRASRWVPESVGAADPAVAPRAVAVLAPRVSGSTSLGNEEHPNGLLTLNEPITAPSNTQPGLPGVFQNTGDSLHATSSFSLPNGPWSIDNSTTPSVLGSPSRAFAEAPNTSAHSLGFNSTFSLVSGLQLPVDIQGTFDQADFSLTDLPAVNNMGTFMLQDTRQILPFAQLEQSILSKGIVLERSAGRTIFGGFASRVVAGILSSRDQSLVRRTPDLQRFLHMLGAQIPGESFALITDDQAFETKFARALLFSMLNGFAGLDEIPMEGILRFLNRILVNKLLLDILEQSPQYVSRTLADNIFRAAVEAADTKVVGLLLHRKLVDVNETVCFHNTQKYTPIERASALRSLNLMRSLIDAGADVNKSHASSEDRKIGGALIELLYGRKTPREDDGIDKHSAVSSESIEAVKTLAAAGAWTHQGIIFLVNHSQTIEVNILISQNVPPEWHRAFVENQVRIGLSNDITLNSDDRDIMMFYQNLINMCHQASLYDCLGRIGGRNLEEIVAQAASAGKLGLVQLLLREAGVRLDLPRLFIVSIQSKNPAMIDFILSRGPDLDPPVTSTPSDLLLGGSRTTPIAEAVRSGNENLIRVLEAAGCLDHLTEGGRFEAVVVAAAESGNAPYMRKLLARSGTSKQAYRITQRALESALGGNHQDIVHMLLEAGVTSLEHFKFGRVYVKPALKDVQMVYALIASGVDIVSILVGEGFSEIDPSIASVAFNEYPGFRSRFSNDVHDAGLQQLFLQCIQTDTLDSFRELIQNSDLEKRSLDGCLAVAVELGHSELIGYLLDMGANPFHDLALRAAIPERPDMLRLLLQKERRRQIIPKCIGARVLEPVIGNGAGNVEALDELIRTGAINFGRLEILYHDQETVGPQGEHCHSTRFTPLGMAIQGAPGRFESNMVAMKKLLDAGADPDGISKLNEQWTKGSPLMTALMVAIETGLEDAVNMLLDYGADVDARPRIRTTRTALQFAAELGNMDMVRLLLSRGADVNSSASPRGGATALQFAAMSGNCNMVALLLEHGAELGALPSKIDGMWPLEGAAANGRLDMIRYLWELKDRAVASWEFPRGFSDRECLRAMSFAREKVHIGCRDFISELSGISVARLETDEYGAPWIAYTDID